jgi:8-oxo-dGTP diphosphatase
VIQVVAALVEGADRGRQRRSLLLARRARGLTHGGLWELPGGKVEAGEEPEAALLRELREELGVGASLQGEHCRYELRVEGRDFLFIVFRASLEELPFSLTAHDGLDFFEAQEIAGLKLAPLDLPALRLWAEGA